MYKNIFFLILGLSLFYSCPKNKKFDIEITPEGGTYDFGNGISLIVPAGAVNSKIIVEVTLTDKTNAAELLSPLEIEESDIIGSIKAEPTSLKFNFPVKIMLSGIHLEKGTIPIVHQIDYDLGTYVMPKTTIEYNPQSNTLGFAIDHFSDYVTHAAEQLQTTECEEIPCRCGSIKVEQSDLDYSCSSSDCQIAGSTVKVNFLDCGYTEEATFKEISAGCKPILSLSAGKRIISRNESTELKATIILGCMPIDNQSIDFTHDDLGTVNPSYVETDETGDANTVFAAGNVEGTSKIQARTTISYYEYEISANGETYHGPMKTEELIKEIDIIINDTTEVYKVEIDVSAQNAQRSSNVNWYYDMTLTYSAYLSFEVILPKGDTNVVDISGIIGTGTQSLGNISVSKNDIPFQNSHCLSARISSTNFPSSFVFKTDYAWVNVKTKEGEFAIQHPLHNHGYGGGCCWASWIINLVIEYRFGQSSVTDSREDEHGFGCLHPMEGGINPPFSVKFENSYTKSGNSWMGVGIEPINYVLKISKLQ